MPAQAGAMRMGLRLWGRPEQRGFNTGEVSWNQASRRLPGVPGSHREGSALAFAQCAGEYRNVDHRVVCDVAWIEREGPLLFPPGIAVFQPREDRSRPGRRL